MPDFYEQAVEDPKHGWVVPLSVWAPLWGISENDLDAEYNMQMALTGQFVLKKDWVRHFKGLQAKYGEAEDLDAIYRGETGQ